MIFLVHAFVIINIEKQKKETCIFSFLYIGTIPLGYNRANVIRNLPKLCYTYMSWAPSMMNQLLKLAMSCESCCMHNRTCAARTILIVTLAMHKNTM